VKSGVKSGVKKVCFISLNIIILVVLCLCMCMYVYVGTFTLKMLLNTYTELELSRISEMEVCGFVLWCESIQYFNVWGLLC
jgi:hypothetical protein